MLHLYNFQFHWISVHFCKQGNICLSKLNCVFQNYDPDRIRADNNIISML